MIAMLLLAAHGRIPEPLYKILCRAYGFSSDRRLRWQAGRPNNYRLMVAGAPDGPGEEWVRYTGRYRLPIVTSEQAVARLTEAERTHPDYTWWIAPGDGSRRLRTFEEDYAPLLDDTEQETGR